MRANLLSRAQRAANRMFFIAGARHHHIQRMDSLQRVDRHQATVALIHVKKAHDAPGCRYECLVHPLNLPPRARRRKSRGAKSLCLKIIFTKRHTNA